MIKAAFFDVDGTLLSFKTHRMPDSTKRALERLREQGIKLIVSSGRAVYALPEEVRDAFDAFVTLNGQLCFDERGVFRSLPIDPADVRAMVDQVRGGCYDVAVLQRERCFCNRLAPRILQNCREVGLMYEVDDIDRALEEPVYQMCVYVEPGEEGVFMDVTRSVEHARWCNLFCDVFPLGGGKALGVRAALERYGITRDEAVAFGDGENDLTMFETVGKSVAMGNAWDSVKERASYVTSDVDHDGIWNACEHLGLL